MDVQLSIANKTRASVYISPTFDIHGELDNLTAKFELEGPLTVP